MKIIIVESPSKSKTIESYMGSDYKVYASQGHIRDLSTSGKGGLGIDIPSGFLPRYEVIKGKEKIVSDLKKACMKNEVFLATDPDREGEAISWHLACVLGLDVNTVNRVEFNEITKNAILEAFQNPRHIDLKLVASQETRRMLDRIIGFDLSHLLQKKIKMKSAGRVQSSVLKIIVDQDKEIEAFIPEDYYQVEAKFQDKKLMLVDDNLKTISFKSKEEALTYPNFLRKNFICKDIIEKEVKKESKPPLITSTLQQEASIRYGFSADRTMRAAQSLYEGKQIGNIHVGLITYMRTDSQRLSDQFIWDAKKYIEEHYGKEYVGYQKNKTKGNSNVQDAHEAIRPTSLERSPYDIDQYLTPDERKVYRLIYNASIASLMQPARYKEKTYLFDSDGYTFKYSGKNLVFKGFLALHSLSDEEEDGEPLNVDKGNEVTVDSINVLELQTKPKARFTEASIIKTMEDKGIGRPSTYAQTISILKARKYIEIKEKKIYPTQDGKLTIMKLEEFFSAIIEPTYTASMEEMLDKVALGELNNVVELQKFYNDFYPLYVKATSEMEGLPEEKTGELCPKCGSPLVIRNGKFGNFISCSNYPTCTYRQNGSGEELEKIMDCPVCGMGHIVKRNGKNGIFYSCDRFPKCKALYQYRPLSIYCEVCGSVMLDKPGGAICSNKECETHSYSKDNICKCPNCKSGYLVERIASKGKTKGKKFYACNQYPKCKTVYSYRPTGQKCDKCGAMLLDNEGTIICSNPECENFVK